MDVTKLISISGDGHTVHHISYPHDELQNLGPDPVGGEEPIALFFGAGFRNIPDLKHDGYIARINRCLEYMRQQCIGCRLYYKPHPAETDEYTLLDLRGFEVVQEKNIADTYLEENRAEIRYVFSVHSIASMTAYSLGINSYIFIDLFESVYNPTLFRWYRDVFFTEMPNSFFIGDLSRPLVENKKHISDTHELAEQLRGILAGKNGTVWCILTVSPLDALISVAKMVKKIYPKRKLGLLLYRHHRWDKMNLDDVRPYFDEVHIFPRTFYSLQPRRLLQIFRLTRSVKNFPIGDEDVFIGFAGYELLENAFISYHSKNLRISFWTYRSFLVHQNTAHNDFFKKRIYHFTPASFVYNKILLPLLGLHRVIFLKPAGADSELYTIHRYQQPMNEIYDHVFYLHA